MDKVSQVREKFSLLDRVPIGTCVLQSDRVVLFWNCCLEEWTKIPRSKILGTCISEHFPHFNQPQYAKRLYQIFQGGPPTIFSSQLHKHIIPAPLPQGRWRIQHTTVTAVPALDGEEFYALLSIQDVTDLTFRVQEYRNMRDLALAEAQDRQIAQEAAEEANRIKDEFVAIVSHELRSPLNPILGWAKLLKRKRLDEETTLRALDTIERNALTQAQLIDDLLDVSRILRGKLRLNFEIVDLASTITDALETVQLAAQAKSIQIKVRLDAGVRQIRGDSHRLEQVVWNLLSNAVKFTPSGGQVDVCLEQVNSQVQLRVSDTGKGIHPDFLPHVFEYFRQADSSMTRSFGGLGLGLAIVRQLVELHGGMVWAESPGEGRGATFILNIPVVAEEAGGELANTEVPAGGLYHSPLPLAGVRVLVVDDDVDTREFLAFLLEQYGAIATVAASANEAIAAIAQWQPDLLLSDLGMPDVDGFGLIRQLRAMSPDQGGQIPAIALSAYAAEATQQQVVAAGFQRYIAKPAEPTELVVAIASLVSSKSAV